MPLVSVVIPVFNRSKSVRAAAQSALAQGFRDLELIIVDDGSTDELTDTLSSVFKDARTLCVRHDLNRGVSAARNTGIGRAKGRYVAFLDSDDIWHPSKLERQLAFVQVDAANRRVSCTGYRLVGAANVSDVHRLPESETSFKDLIWGCRLSPGSTMMVERSLFETVGPFEESLPRLEDWEWLLRCSRYATISGCREILVDVHHSGYRGVNRKEVARSAQIFASYVCDGRYDASWRERLVLLSTIRNEIAAIDYRQGRYAAALRNIAISLALRPWKHRAHLLRLMRTVYRDIREAVRR